MSDDGDPVLWYIVFMQKAILVAIVVVALAVIGWAVFRAGGGAPEPRPEPEPGPAPPATEPVAPGPSEPAPAEEPAPAQQPEPEPEEPLPPLPESDAFVRERLEPLDLPEPWLEQGDYVRRLAVLAENAARGTYPRRQLSFLAPEGRFQVTREDDRIFVDPASYRRYDPYVEELVQADPAQVADLLETLNPLVESALQEIGVQAPPGEVFARAVAEVLAAPVPEGRVELVQPNVMYEYADPRLEGLSSLKKQVMRMGPDNTRRLQAYLRQVAAEMNVEVPEAAGAGGPG